MTAKTRIRPRQSEKLTNDEHQAFKDWVKSFPTKHDAFLAFPFSKITLDAVLLKGSGKPGTCAIIRGLVAPILLTLLKPRQNGIEL